MAHLLAKLKGVPVEKIKERLKADAPFHAKEGFYLEHIWQNADNPDEVLFLFRADDLNRVKKFIGKVHEDARKQDPNANLPLMTFLEEK
jgi:hypothetical protein